MSLTAERMNSQQAEAMERIVGRVNSGEPVSKLFGYAGTGKTSIAKAIADNFPGTVMFGAFTGKAASVLTRKGCSARTIHSRIYLPQGDRKPKLALMEKHFEGMTEEEQLGEDGQALLRAIDELRANINKPGFVLNPGSELAEADLFIVDEVSMVDERLARDILSFEVPLIVLGDPAQLPPVGNGGYFTKGGEKAADALLTQVMRQDEGGPIINLATHIRRHQCLPLDGDPQVVDMVTAKQALTYDQILVGKNSTRWSKNLKMRKLLGRSDLVEVGERIICLENHRTIECMNGQQFVVVEVAESSKEGQINALIRCECEPDPGDVSVNCPDCGWRAKWVPMWLGGFISEKEEAAVKSMAFGKKQAAMFATYGYAITVHKAQGSEWKNVLVYDESSVFRADDWRWLYTAVTRASERLTLVS